MLCFNHTCQWCSGTRYLTLMLTMFFSCFTFFGTESLMLVIQKVKLAYKFASLPKILKKCAKQLLKVVDEDAYWSLLDYARITNGVWANALLLFFSILASYLVGWSSKMIMAAANNCWQAIIAATKGRLLTASILGHNRCLIENDKTKN